MQGFFLESNVMQRILQKCQLLSSSLTGIWLCAPRQYHPQSQNSPPKPLVKTEHLCYYRTDVLIQRGTANGTPHHCDTRSGCTQRRRCPLVASTHSSQAPRQQTPAPAPAILAHAPPPCHADPQASSGVGNQRSGSPDLSPQPHKHRTPLVVGIGQILTPTLSSLEHLFTLTRLFSK